MRASPDRRRNAHVGGVAASGRLSRARGLGRTHCRPKRRPRLNTHPRASRIFKSMYTDIYLYCPAIFSLTAVYHHYYFFVQFIIDRLFEFGAIHTSYAIPEIPDTMVDKVGREKVEEMSRKRKIIMNDPNIHIHVRCIFIAFSLYTSILTYKYVHIRT